MPQRPEFAAETGLLVAAPGGFDVGGLHVIHPDDSGAQGFHYAKGFEDVAGPDCRGEAVGRGVGDGDGIGFIREWNHRGYRAEDFFLRDAVGIVHVVENSGLDVIAFCEFRGTSTAGCQLGFFFAEIEIGTYAVVLIVAD